MKGLLSPPRRPQINSRSQLDARGGPGLPDVIRCARRKHARSIISSFLRDSGMHQARLFIPIVFLLYSLSFSVSAATLPSGFIETTVASGMLRPQRWQLHRMVRSEERRVGKEWRGRRAG